jgi:hypothetical protein
MGQAARKRCVETLGHVRCHRLARTGDKAFMAKPDGMTEQHPRIELGRLDPRLA